VPLIVSGLHRLRWFATGTNAAAAAPTEDDNKNIAAAANPCTRNDVADRLGEEGERRRILWLVFSADVNTIGCY